MLIPQVVGVKLTGRLREGATATDLVLTITEMLRKHGVVGKFVEYFGPGLRDLPLADRATIGNMSPEYGATCGIFPVDKETLSYLRLTGRSEEQIALVEAYCREQGLFHDEGTPQAEYSELLALDLATVEPSLAGPKRPQDRVVLSQAKESFEKALPGLMKAPNAGTPDDSTNGNGQLHHGSVVIAAITSCTNTSNPSVMLAAGILARKAVERGLEVPEWVKTSLAPGSKVVRDYLEAAGLTGYLEKLKFHIVGYGCTTCIGNSGPLPQEVSEEIDEKNLVVASVLSGNRNFEGRINPDVRANYLMSPPLVVAFALAGRIDVDLRRDPRHARVDRAARRRRLIAAPHQHHRPLPPTLRDGVPPRTRRHPQPPRPRPVDAVHLIRTSPRRTQIRNRRAPRQRLRSGNRRPPRRPPERQRRNRVDDRTDPTNDRLRSRSDRVHAARLPRINRNAGQIERRTGRTADRDVRQSHERRAGSEGE